MSASGSIGLTLQYTLNGQRFYEEFETSSLQDAMLHGPRIVANDPSGIFIPQCELWAAVVASKQGIIATQSPALRQEISDVVDSLDQTDGPPPGVRQGGLPGKPGVYGNRSGVLPVRPEGYYKESDVWPGPGPRGTERIVVGDRGEVWYTPDHYGTFWRWP